MWFDIRYNCDEDGPRPESYAEDYNLANQHCKSEDEKSALYKEMKTGAESGWDYSSRWFVTDKNNNSGCLKDTKPRAIVPVDLNSIMAKNAEILAHFCCLTKQWVGFYHLITKSIRVWKWIETFILNCQAKTDVYETDKRRLTQAMDEVLWCKDEGIWFDFDLSSGTRRQAFSLSNAWPLWTETFQDSVKRERAIEYLRR